MTLPKKTSRVTMVDSVEYRWTVSRQEFYNSTGATTLLTFMAHEVRTEPKLPHPKLRVSFYDNHCDVVTPSLASSFIRGGLQKGWDPRGKEDHVISGNAAIKLICL